MCGIFLQKENCACICCMYVSFECAFMYTLMHEQKSIRYNLNYDKLHLCSTQITECIFVKVIDNELNVSNFTDLLAFMIKQVIEN